MSEGSVCTVILQGYTYIKLEILYVDVLKSKFKAVIPHARHAKGLLLFYPIVKTYSCVLVIACH